MLLSCDKGFHMHLSPPSVDATCLQVWHTPTGSVHIMLGGEGNMLGEDAGGMTR
jgi:hypothetical protein